MSYNCCAVQPSAHPSFSGYPISLATVAHVVLLVHVPSLTHPCSLIGWLRGWGLGSGAWGYLCGAVSGFPVPQWEYISHTSIFHILV